MRHSQLKRALAFSVQFIGVGVQRSSFTPARHCQFVKPRVLFLLLGKFINQLRAWRTWLSASAQEPWVASKYRHLWKQVGGKLNASALGSSAALALEGFFEILVPNVGSIARKKLTNCSSRQLTVGDFGLVEFSD
ncbi:hypothetical protein ACNUDM_06340 [Vibrio chaetopteri]|uniref:hypothetical protein n=1 Tax=Vibrio chaetopteri TaxID=3016528 RepID=UPI003AB89AD4